MIDGNGFSGYNLKLGLGAVHYISGNATSNGTVNIYVDGTRSLDSYMLIGESITCVLLVTNGSTAYYPTAYQIDGSAVTPKWLGGTAPSAGNASSIDMYTFTIIKTGSATYSVLASQSKFA
jgi:hypothetical protein